MDLFLGVEGLSTACAHGFELSAGGPFPACVALAEAAGALVARRASAQTPSALAHGAAAAAPRPFVYRPSALAHAWPARRAHVPRG